MRDDPTHAPVAVRLAAGVGGLLAANGVLFFAAPDVGLRLFGLPRAPADVLPPLLGIREIAFGLAILLLAYRGRVRDVAGFMLLGAVVPVVDAIVVIQATGVEAALPHLVAVPTCVGLGVMLWRSGPGSG